VWGAGCGVRGGHAPGLTHPKDDPLSDPDHSKFDPFKIPMPLIKPGVDPEVVRVALRAAAAVPGAIATTPCCQAGDKSVLPRMLTTRTWRRRSTPWTPMVTT
jgi:hypothetical protein